MTARVARPDSLALQQMWWMSRVVASEGASASTRLRRDVRVLDAGMWSRIMLLAPLRVGYGSRVRAKETWNRSSAPHSTCKTYLRGVETKATSRRGPPKAGNAPPPPLAATGVLAAACEGATMTRLRCARPCLAGLETSPVFPGQTRESKFWKHEERS